FDRGKRPINSNTTNNGTQQGGKGPVWSRITWGSNKEVIKNQQGVFGNEPQSFVDVVSGKKQVNKVIIEDVKDSLTKEWLKISLIGRIPDYNTFNKLHVRLEEEGYARIQIRHVGGLMVLLTFHGGEEAEAFRDCMWKRKDIFESLEFWDCMSMNRERIVWLKITGVPPNLWDSEVVDKIGSVYGKVICSSEADAYDVNLAWKKVGIVTNSFDPIDGTILLEWRKTIPRCRVTEFVDEWYPDFVWGQAGLAKETRKLQSSVSRVNEDHVEEERLDINIKAKCMGNEEVRCESSAGSRCEDEEQPNVEEYDGGHDVEDSSELHLDNDNNSDKGSANKEANKKETLKSVLKNIGLTSSSLNGNSGENVYLGPNLRSRKGYESINRSGPILRSHTKSGNIRLNDPLREVSMATSARRKPGKSGGTQGQSNNLSMPTGRQEGVHEEIQKTMEVAKGVGVNIFGEDDRVEKIIVGDKYVG
ncbi:hypothetical protein SSX86_030766, partial [Deinandra increscens subsp. villosa]